MRGYRARELKRGKKDGKETKNFVISQKGQTIIRHYYNACKFNRMEFLFRRNYFPTNWNVCDGIMKLTKRQYYGLLAFGLLAIGFGLGVLTVEVLLLC